MYLKTSTFVLEYRCLYGAWRSLASALAWGARGRRFKSCRPDFQLYPPMADKKRIYKPSIYN